MPDVMEQLSKPQSSLSAESPAATPRRSPVKFIVLGMLVLALGAGGWAWFHFQDQVSSDDAQVDAHITAVAPKIPGNVLEVLVLDNQAVKAGDVLVRIDPRDYQARVDIARAALLQAQSQLHTAQTVVPLTNDTTQSGATGATAQLADAMAELDRARLAYEQANSSDIAVSEAKVRPRQANNERAQADLARMKPLVDKAEISRLQYDAYLASARVAESELRTAQEELASAQQERRHQQGGACRRAIARERGPGAGGSFVGQSQAGGRAHAPKPAPPQPVLRPRAPTSQPPNCNSATPRMVAPSPEWSPANRWKWARLFSPAKVS